jgi:hypothetical protein
LSFRRDFLRIYAPFSFFNKAPKVVVEEVVDVDYIRSFARLCEGLFNFCFFFFGFFFFFFGILAGVANIGSSVPLLQYTGPPEYAYLFDREIHDGTSVI